jgi:phosphoglycerate dehydrogenase-like enzyme
MLRLRLGMTTSPSTARDAFVDNLEPLLYGFAMSRVVWIRLPLLEEEFTSLCDSGLDCEFCRGQEIESDAELLRRIEGVFTEEPLPEELTKRMTNLKWLHVTRGGVSAYLTSDVKKRPIEVTSSKGIHGQAFAEFALACMFALAKMLPQCWQAQREKQWMPLTPEDIGGKTLGIVGLGTVGSELARKAKALGLKVLATKRTAGEKPEFVDELGGPDLLLGLLRQSDFVVLSLASIPSTTNIIGEQELRAMKKSAYLINLTAGRAIDENLLAKALKDRWIAGAALDAFARQPLPADSELWSLSNLIVTPRIGGLSAQKWPLLMPIFTDNLKRFIAGESLRNLVDKELGY